MGPLITVVIPTRKIDSSLRECVEKVKNQSLNKDLYSVYVVLNSKDLPSEEIDFLKGVEVFREPKVGIPFARNFMLDRVNTKYISYIDSDVLLPHNWLETMLNVIISTNSSIVQSRIDQVHREKLLDRYRYWKRDKLSNHTLINLDSSGATFPVFNTAACLIELDSLNQVGGFNVEFLRLSDIVMAKLVGMNGGVICGTNKVTAYIHYSGNWLTYFMRCFSTGIYLIKYVNFFSLEKEENLKVAIIRLAKLVKLVKLEKYYFLFLMDKLFEITGFILGRLFPIKEKYKYQDKDKIVVLLPNKILISKNNNIKSYLI